MKPSETYAGTGIFHHLGFDLPDAEEGRITGYLDIGPEHLNRMGYVHGGVISTMLDAACCGAGLYSPPGASPRYAITLSLTVNFTNPVREGRLTVKGELVSAARTMFTGEGKVFAENGDLVAQGIGTFRWRKESRPDAATGSAG